MLTSTSASELMARDYHDELNIKTQSCALGFAQSAFVGTTLYVDGGYVWYNNGSNHEGPNMWLRVLDTSKSFTVDNIDEIPIEFQERPEEIPEVSGGNLWAYKDTLYLQQGYSERSDTSWPGWNPLPNGTVFDFWKYDIKTTSWSLSQHNPETISGAAVPRTQHSTSLVIESLAKAYLIGGEIMGGNGGFLKGTMIYDFEEGSWEFRTTRAWTNWASGLAAHVPVEDPGYILAFAGRSKEYNKLDRIEVYDLEKNTWGNVQQTTPADTRFPFPLERQKPCSVIARAKDGSSYNIYVFGGINLSGTSPYNDLWVLSIPSFKWFLVNSGSTGGPQARETMSCHIVGGGRKMLVYGGRHSHRNYAADLCDQTGVHVFDMTTLQWEDVYDPDGGEYEVPKVIYDVIGGDSDGGATLLPVGGFANPEMEAKFTTLISKIQESSDNGNATNTNSVNEPSATTGNPALESDSTATSTKRSISTGAIAGIVVGVIIAVVLLVALVLLRKHLKRKKPRTGLHPAELSGVVPTQELHQYHYASVAQELHTAPVAQELHSTPMPTEITPYDDYPNSATMQSSSYYEPGKLQPSDPSFTVAQHQHAMSDYSYTASPQPSEHPSSFGQHHTMEGYRTS